MRILIVAIYSLALMACGSSDSCREYSEFTCAEIEKANYNVYFYYPSGSEKYLGQSQGLSQCGWTAHNFASAESLSSNSEWSYVCCMITESSSCFEKHR